jgi:hypothetical protein
VTPLKRFEKTGGVTLRNLIGILRGLGLLDHLETLIPAPASPSPMELLTVARKVKPPRQRAPRSRAPGQGAERARRERPRQPGTRHG